MAVNSIDSAVDAEACCDPARRMATLSSISFNDIILIPPLDGDDGATVLPLFMSATGKVEGEDGNGVAAANATDAMLRKENAWRGLICIRDASSPWYGGCFDFSVYFPSRYPFDTPIIIFSKLLRSHPMMQEQLSSLSSSMQQPQQLHHSQQAVDYRPLGSYPASEQSFRSPHPGSTLTMGSTAVSSSAVRQGFLPFESEYCSIDPMRVSVMSALLHYIRRVFYPSEWPQAWVQRFLSSPAGSPGPAPAISRVRARRDVNGCSVTQEVMLDSPFARFMVSDVMGAFMARWQRAQDGETEEEADIAFAELYTREILPQLSRLP